MELFIDEQTGRQMSRQTDGWRDGQSEETQQPTQNKNIYFVECKIPPTAWYNIFRLKEIKLP